MDQKENKYSLFIYILKILLYYKNEIKFVLILMESISKIEERILQIEKQINCQNLEKRISILENEVKHLKAVLQYQLRNKQK